MPKSLDALLLDLEQKSQPISPSDTKQRFALTRKLAMTLGIKQPTAKVVTVTGTNGKGSVVSCLEALFLASKLKTVCLSSPHLVNFNERLRVNGRGMDEQKIASSIEVVIEAIVANGYVLNYFIVINLALLLLIPDDADIVVLEVGVGGRYDIINLVDCDVAIITSIGLDHMALLGNTRESIAEQKIGIARAGKPLIIGEPNPPSNLTELVKTLNCEPYQLNSDFSVRLDGNHLLCELPQQTVSYSFYSNCFPVNQAIALMCFDLLYSADRFNAQHLERLGHLQVPGRCQAIEGQPRYLLDVAHNEDSIKRLAQAIQSTRPSPKKIWAIFGIKRDKSIAQSLKRLKPLITEWLIAKPEDPRLATPDELQQMFHAVDITCYHKCASFQAALLRVQQQAAKEDLVVIFGSFVVVGEIMTKLAPFAKE